MVLKPRYMPIDKQGLNDSGYFNRKIPKIIHVNHSRFHTTSYIGNQSEGEKVKKLGTKSQYYSRFFREIHVFMHFIHVFLGITFQKKQSIWFVLLVFPISISIAEIPLVSFRISHVWYNTLLFH